ncbi:MAG TPA: TonB family protein [Burkholderiales bacterium]|nr:TonB family protein [Burkholderiales bacterium]
MMWYPDPATARLHHHRELHALYAAVGASVALHAFAMVAFPGLRVAAAPEEPAALTAMFASAAAPTPLRRARERQEPERIPAQKAPDPIPVAAPAATEPVPVQEPAPEPASTPSLATAAPAPATEAADTSLFDAYRLALINTAKRYKRYPVQAMERGWEGRVEIRVTVDANGMIKSALVRRSSRYQVLDDQALEMVRKAFSALAQVRPAPMGREFTVDVPVVFELQTG